MDRHAPGTPGNGGTDAVGRIGGDGSTILVVAADPTVRAALAALCRTTTGVTVRDERTLPADGASLADVLVVVDPGDASQGVPRTLTAAAALSVPVLVIPPAWRDALLAGVLGDAVVVPEIAVVVAAALAAATEGGTAAVSLAAREREVVRLVAAGRTDAEIAAELGIATSTVRSHLDRIGQKTGARRRPALVRLARRLGLAAGLEGPGD
ncbi:MAG: LuxR C-terminal-related transcriptional regulator [Actinomycetes bacterium]